MEKNASEHNFSSLTRTFTYQMTVLKKQTTNKQTNTNKQQQQRQQHFLLVPVPFGYKHHVDLSHSTTTSTIFETTKFIFSHFPVRYIYKHPNSLSCLVCTENLVHLKPVIPKTFAFFHLGYTYSFGYSLGHKLS